LWVPAEGFAITLFEESTDGTVGKRPALVWFKAEQPGAFCWYATFSVPQASIPFAVVLAFISGAWSG